MKKVIFFLSITVSTAWAGGTAVNGVATRAQSMQAFTAVADDASSIFYNSAGLTDLKSAQIQVDFQGMLPKQTYRSQAGTTTKSTRKAFVANAFYSRPINERVTFGLGFYAPFARDSSYTVNAALGNRIHFNKLLRLDLAPTVAYKVNNSMSIGVAPVLAYVKSKGELFALAEDADGFGLGYQLSALFKLPRNWRLGFNFRSRLTARIHGETTGTTTDDFSSDSRFPAVANIGLAWKPKDSLQLSADIEHQFWDQVPSIVKEYDNNPAATTVLNPKNSWVYRIGGRYQQDESNEWRAGYALATIALPKENIVPAIIDYKGHYFSVGYSHWFETLRLDLGYEYLYSPTRDGSKSIPTLITPGKYAIKMHTLMLGLAYQFN